VIHFITEEELAILFIHSISLSAELADLFHTLHLNLGE